ncbi:unnamed protein product [Sphagnum balticum]
MGDHQDPVILASYGSHKGGANAVQFRPHMKHVVSGGADFAVLLWSLHCRTNLRYPIVRPYRFLGHQGAVCALAVSPLDNVVASGSKDKTVRLWLPTVEAKSTVIKAHGGAVRTIGFSHDGQFLLTGSDDKTIKIWLVHKQKFLVTLTGHLNWLRSAEFSPDDRHICSGGDDRTIRLWDVERHECLQHLEGMGMINSVRFHPDGSCLGTGGNDQCVQIWDIRSKMLIQHYAPNAGVINSVCFHPSGNFLLSTCEDSTIRIWDLREGQILYCLQGHEGATTCAEFSPNGDYFVSGSADEHVMVWRTNFDQTARAPQALLGSIHQEGPGIAHCPACQCICSTSKDFADHMLGGDSLTHAQASVQHKIYDQQQAKVPTQHGEHSPNQSPARSPSPPASINHTHGKVKVALQHTDCSANLSPLTSPQNLQVKDDPTTCSLKHNCSAHFSPSQDCHGPAHSGKRPEPMKCDLESFGKTLEQIARQLDVLTRTVALLEDRLSHTEDKVRVNYHMP